MKKVLITHITNTLNYGSAMMAINLIHDIKQYFSNEEIEIHCECDEYHLKRLKIATGDESIKNIIFPSESSLGFISKFKKYIFGSGEVNQIIGSMFNAMIVLGGDDLSETDMKGAIKRSVSYYHINRNCRVILAGQSLGPFRGIYKTIAKFLFKDIVLITRDDNSYDFAFEQLKIKNIFKSRDLALSALPKQEIFNNILKENDLYGKDYVVFVPSGLVHEYTNNMDEYVETWKTIAENILNLFPEYKLLMLAHVLLPEHASDGKVIEKVYDELEEKYSEKLLTLIDEMQPAEARAILGNSKFVVTGRMHPAVSTLFMRKPVVALAYSAKYEGVISRGLDLPELVVDCRKKHWGKDSDIVNMTLERVEYIKQNRNVLVDKIDKNVSESSNMVKEQIKYIADTISES